MMIEKFKLFRDRPGHCSLVRDLDSTETTNAYTWVSKFNARTYILKASSVQSPLLHIFFFYHKQQLNSMSMTQGLVDCLVSGWSFIARPTYLAQLQLNGVTVALSSDFELSCRQFANDLCIAFWGISHTISNTRLIEHIWSFSDFCASSQHHELPHLDCGSF